MQKSGWVTKQNFELKTFFSYWASGGKFSNPANLIGSGSGRNFPMLPNHDAIPPAPETAGTLEVKLFYSVA